jgi:cysteinyl-tRNA synthetase
MSKLTIYNTLSGKKEELKPMKGKKVNLFVCGPTVYDYVHLGNARTCIIFDAFAKYLKYSGYSVFYLQNITDVDDKIIQRAREKQVPFKDLAEAFEQQYFKDMKAIGVTAVKKYAKATSHIKDIISQIKRLKEKGFAYDIEGDGVYFDISKFKDYGKLAGRTVQQAEDGVTRIDYSRDKRNRGDFCLWKLRQDESEPSWASPFGHGRPGWHIEDTAITEKFFGAQYDIHGGGQDLIFPHHEAEVAQMEAVSGKKPMAKYWMHTGFLTINGQKMSKSLGNFMFLQDFLHRYPANYLRYFVLKNLWRQPIDYSESSMMEVKSAIEKIEELLRKLKMVKTKGRHAKLAKKLSTEFYDALNDDFSTPKAFAVMFDFVKVANQLITEDKLSDKDAKEIFTFFKEMNTIFGIIDFKKIGTGAPAAIQKMVQERETARQNQDWKTSDELRKLIESKGYILEDTKDGAVIKKR